jgi:general secretion pathway protein J
MMATSPAPAPRQELGPRAAGFTLVEVRPRAAGFTLVELIIALAIVATLLVTAFGGLRVVLAAVQRGEARIEAHQHVRSLTTLLTRAVGAAYPYRGPLGEARELRLLFRGEASTLEFVSQAPPFPLAATIAFTAVALSRVEGEGLVIRERALPNHDPFKDAIVVLRDPTVTSLSFRYLDDTNGWQTAWEDDDSPPSAIEITVGMIVDGRAETLPPMIVPMRIGVE